MKYEESSYLTKKMFADCLKQQMNKKPLKNITVSELIKLCNVNRKTFYYHFVDIYDLLKWMLEQEAIEIVKSFNLQTQFKDALYFAIDYIKNNSHILNCAYDSLGREEMKRFLYNDFNDITNRYIISVKNSLQVECDTKYIDFLTVSYTEMIAGMIINCFKGNEEVDSNTAIDYLYFTITNSIPNLLINRSNIIKNS